MSAALELVDPWADGITVDRPPAGKFSAGFECNDADPDIFNFLLFYYGSALREAQEHINALLDTDLQIIRQNIASVTMLANSNAVKINTAPSDIASSTHRLATAQEITNVFRGIASATIGTAIISADNMAAVFLRETSATIRGTFFNASGLSVAVGQAEDAAITPAAFKDYAIDNAGLLEIAFGRGPNITDMFHDTITTPSGQGNQEWTFDISVMEDVKGMWTVEWFKSTGGGLRQQTFIVNYVDYAGDNPPASLSIYERWPVVGGVDAFMIAEITFNPTALGTPADPQATVVMSINSYNPATEPDTDFALQKIFRTKHNPLANN